MAVFTSSWDDGHPLDLRIAELLDKYGLTATFYVPITNREGMSVMSASECRQISARHEIGSHTRDHCYLNTVDLHEAESQIINGKSELEDLLGSGVEGFCYPGGKWSQSIENLVKNAGFSYARGTDNFYLSSSDNRYLLPTTIQFYPHDFSVYLRNFLSRGHWSARHRAFFLAIAERSFVGRLIAIFDFALSTKAVFHLWGHSWEIEEINAWKELEIFLEYVSSRIISTDALTNAKLVKQFY